MKDYPVIEEDKFEYIETRPGHPRTLLLLHGLFGATGNFKTVLDGFADYCNVVVPMLPIYKLPLRKVSITGLLNHVVEFVDRKGYTDIDVLGNSLGGHIAVLYTLAHQDKIRSIILTGSSGLFENSMGNTFPKRGNYEFIKKKCQNTFYDPSIATKEVVDEVYDAVNDRNKAIRIVATAKSAIRHNVASRLDQITVPALLIWGEEDTITPHYAAEKYHEGLPNSELVWIKKCGHAAMMEHPKYFNKILMNFLERLNA